jgi:hypothetical protein
MRRIWIWWSECVDNKVNLFFTALDQASNASLERLFSVLKLAVKVIGQTLLDETLETQLFVQYKMLRHWIFQSPAS